MNEDNFEREVNLLFIETRASLNTFGRKLNLIFELILELTIELLLLLGCLNRLFQKLFKLIFVKLRY